MTATYEHLPVLVYGTLREGQGNYANLIAPTNHVLSRVFLDGYRMHGGWGYPYITEDEDYSVVCDMVEFSDEDFYSALRSLDGLEGYHGAGPEHTNHYDRKIVTVYPEGKPVRAYVYVVSDYSKYRLAGLPVIEHGDWIRWEGEQERLEALREAARRKGEQSTGEQYRSQGFSAFGPIEDSSAPPWDEDAPYGEY